MTIFFLETTHIEKCSVITGKDGIYQLLAFLFENICVK